MESNFDKSLQSKLRQNQELPKSLHWESVSEEIFSKLDNPENHTSGKTKKTFYNSGLRFGSAMLILMGLVSSWVFYHNSIKPKHVENPIKKQPKDTNQSNTHFNATNNNIPTLNTNAKNVIKDSIKASLTNKTIYSISIPKSDDKIYSQQYSSFTKDTKTIIEKNNESLLMSKELILDESSMFSEGEDQPLNLREYYAQSYKVSGDTSYSKRDMINGFHTEATEIYNNPYVLPKGKSSSILNNESENNPVNFSKIENLVPLGSISPEITIKKLDFKPRSLLVSIKPSKKIAYWNISLAAGSSFWSFKKDYEKAIVGISTSIAAERIIKDNWSISLGLDYDIFQSQFYHRYLIRSYTVMQPNTLLSLEYNLITKDTIKTYGVAEVQARDYRKVNWINRYHRIQIPILVHFSGQMHKFNWSVGAGISFSKWSNQSGRSWTEEDVSILENSPSVLPEVFKIGSIIQVDLGKQISKRVEIGLRCKPNLTYESLALSKAPKLNLYTGQTQIYMHYKF
jgi:hypothetical protein